MLVPLPALCLLVSPQTPPVLNAPVAPDAIYLARAAASGGLSIIDLNGFGAGTGDPTYDSRHPAKVGNSNYPNNPNLLIQGALMIPPLAPGTDTRTGGSAGPFTLALDSALDAVHGRGARIADMMLGHPLDLVYDLDASCELCGAVHAQSFGFSAPHALVPATGVPLHNVAGLGNPISWVPFPNPPPLLPSASCGGIEGQEPSSILSALPRPIGSGLTNLLVPGPLPLGIPSIGLPPQNLLARQQNAFFVGPDPNRYPLLSDCHTNMMRQQVGHYLYAIERGSRSVVVLNSNRMSEITRFALVDPVELAMSPDLTYLAVTNRGAGTVDFIDIHPLSPTFHQLVASTVVGALPTGIAWEPDGEDILVCNEGDGTVSILSAATLRVRKTLRHFERPFAVALTPRQDRFGLQRNVYYAYILERSGKLVLFESGPDGPGGWGFDAPILRTRFALTRPRAIQPDPRALEGGVWIAHEGPLLSDGTPTGQSGGALTNLVLRGSQGPILLLSGERPHPRQLALTIARSIGEGPSGLSGVPLDVAFDDQSNLGGLRNYHSAFSAGPPAEMNGKNLVRDVPGVGVLATNLPAFVFVPTSAGQVDVFDLDSGLRVDTNAHRTGVQSIPAAGVWRAMDYFRQ